MYKGCIKGVIKGVIPDIYYTMIKTFKTFKRTYRYPHLTPLTFVLPSPLTPPPPPPPLRTVPAWRHGGSAGTGSGASGKGKSGGSGVIILKMPTANYTGITAGSPVVSTSGSNTILTFNGSGSYSIA